MFVYGRRRRADHMMEWKQPFFQKNNFFTGTYMSLIIFHKYNQIIFVLFSKLNGLNKVGKKITFIILSKRYYKINIYGWSRKIKTIINIGTMFYYYLW